MRTDGKYDGAAQVAMATLTACRFSSPREPDACGVLNTLVRLSETLVVGMTT